MIDELSLRNFKTLRRVDLKLRPLNLIVGPNASGKSSLLQALALLSRCVQGGQVGKELQSHVADGPLVLSCRGSYFGTPMRFRMSFSEKGSQEPLGGEWGGEALRPDVLEKLKYVLEPALELKLEVDKLAALSYSKEILRALPRNGEGLAAFLANYYIENPSGFRALVERLRSVVPVVRDIRLRPAYVFEDTERRVGYELLFDMEGAEGVPARLVSDGTLLTLGLLTILSASDRPQLVLIDDLERGLHPKALGGLVSQLRLLQEQDPELQIVATSHSPYLLDYLEAEEILLTSLDEDGYAAVRPLVDHPDYKRWKGLMAPGEFWSTVGESWVTAQRASA